jgi:hypothetical protein
VRLSIATFLALCIANLCSIPAQAQITVFGPQSYLDLPNNDITTVTTISESDLTVGGGSHLQIEFNVARNELSTGDSWGTLVFYDTSVGPPTGGFFGFTNSAFGPLAVLTRTRTDSVASNPHQVFPTSLEFDTVNSVEFTPLGHTVRVSIDNVNDGLFGSGHTVTFQIDHDSSTFVEEDFRVNGLVDFPDSITLDLRTRTKVHDYNSFMIRQLDLLFDDPADANNDNFVDLLDFELISDNYLSTVPNGTLGDVVIDGFVDIRDFPLWKGRYEEINPGLGAFTQFPGASVPEPSAVSMLVLAFGCLLGGPTRRR